MIVKRETVASWSPTTLVIMRFHRVHGTIQSPERPATRQRPIDVESGHRRLSTSVCA